MILKHTCVHQCHKWPVHFFDNFLKIVNEFSQPGSFSSGLGLQNLSVDSIFTNAIYKKNCDLM